MEKYSIENLGTRKGDLMNSLIMEMASDLAEKLAQKDWEIDDRGENFYVDEEYGSQRLNGDAQEIFNNYYDSLMDDFYTFVNQAVEIDVNETK